MMTLKEKVSTAINHEEVRPVPYTVWYDQKTIEKLDNYYGSTDWQAKIQDHIIRITLNWRTKKFIDDQTYIDVNGSKWQIGAPNHIIEPALPDPCIKNYNIPSYVPILHERKTAPPGVRWTGRYGLDFHDTRELLGKIGNEAFTEVDFGDGLFESAWMIRGFENFYTDLLLEPDFANALLDMLLERQLELLDMLVTLPCDAIMFTDDFGDQRGVAIGPELWRKFVKTRLAKLYARVHAAGKKVFHHSCGNVFDIIPDLIEIGLDVLQSVQPEAMDVYAIKKHYGQNVTLWGAVGTQRLLPLGTPGEIRQEVRRLKQELGKGGGYILTSAKPIMHDVPVENAVALLEESIAPY